MKVPTPSSIISAATTALRLSWSSADHRIQTAFLFGIGAVLASAVLTAIAPLILAMLIDSMELGVADQATPILIALIASYAALLGFSRALAEIRTIIYGMAEQRLNRRLSERTFDHLVRLPLRYHLDNNVGAISQSIASGLMGIRMIVHHIGHTILPLIVEMATVGVVLYRLHSVALFLLFLSASALYSFLILRGSRAMAEPARGVTTASIEAQRLLTDSITNLEAVKSFNAYDSLSTRYQGILSSRERLWTNLYARRAAMGLSTACVFAVSVALALTWSARGVSSGALTLGDFVLVNAYILRLATPLELIGAAVREVTEGAAYVHRLIAILNVDPECTSEAGDTAAAATGRLELRRVTFGYAKGRSVLKDVCLTIPAGATIAIVGPTGSGKSSLIKLLQRLYEPDQGEILLDGIDITALPLSNVREAIAIVPQETILLNDTIANNITLGSAFAHEDVQRAAAMAGLDSEIQRWPDGYETFVGERGMKLSGGERQRIAIARAIIRKPQILVLDEATASLDSRTEQAILGKLSAVADQRTTIIVAHRLNAISHATLILVLSNGELVERGTHAELLASCGLYSALWQAQSGLRSLDT